LGELSVNNEVNNGSDKKTIGYVTKWMRTQHAILFKLSTAMIQVNFLDNSEIYICSDTKVVTYKSKRG